MNRRCPRPHGHHPRRHLMHRHGRPYGHRLWHARVHLRWRIFFWFTIAIIAAGVAAGGILDLTDGGSRPLALVVGGAILWISAGGIAWALTRPLLSIVRVTRELGAGKLDSRIDSHRHYGELGVLAAAVNDMADRIERQLSDQRELLAAVSHELRTPLGHVRILLDTARERGTDPALVGEIEREVVEIDALVAQLLAASRLEFDALEHRDLDAGEVAALALERAGLGPELLEVDTGDTGCRADPTLLARALANLLANAEDHGGGASRLRVFHADDGVAFEVEDAGPGFRADETARVFERFYRGERRAGGSLGLGLALVRRIAEAHDGRAWAANRAGGGARVGFSIAAEHHAGE